MNEIFHFHEFDRIKAITDNTDEIVSMLGAKGTFLSEAAYHCIPVLPGYVLTTFACESYWDDPLIFSQKGSELCLKQITQIESATGKSFGDPEKPLFIDINIDSVRPVPFQLRKFEFIGLTDQIAQRLVEMKSDLFHVYNAYSHLIKTFGANVYGVPEILFFEKFEEYKTKNDGKSAIGFILEDWKMLISEFKRIIFKNTGKIFPEEPSHQLQLATETLLKLTTGKAFASHYRDMGFSPIGKVSLNIQASGASYMSPDKNSIYGIALTRDPATGKKRVRGEYADQSINNRISKPIEDCPDIYQKLGTISADIEAFYKCIMAFHFCIEFGKIWINDVQQARCTPKAVIRCTVEMKQAGLVNRRYAVSRIKPDDVNAFLFPKFQTSIKNSNKPISRGLNVSPGVAVGIVAFDSKTAEEMVTEQKKPVIMVCNEIKPTDMNTLVSIQGILTNKGGYSSHAAVVARHLGIPAIMNIDEMNLDLSSRIMVLKNSMINEGDWISIDGTTGNIYLNRLQVNLPKMNQLYLDKILAWSDNIKRLKIYANSDSPEDVTQAIKNGAEGIGLVRSEHMLLKQDSLVLLQRALFSVCSQEKTDAIRSLLPLHQKELEKIFYLVGCTPVTVRLADPPIDEFYPSPESVGMIKDMIQFETNDSIRPNKNNYANSVQINRNSNSAFGLRGVRLSVAFPDITRMQIRAIFQAACHCIKKNMKLILNILVPFVSHANEIRYLKDLLEDEHDQVVKENRVKITYKLGVMIEVPRAALIADQLAPYVDFFSYGTNDLTQTTFALSRDFNDIIRTYLQQGIYFDNPYKTFDIEGVGKLIEMSLTRGRKVNKQLSAGICGEHDYASKELSWFSRIGIDYISCSPMRIPAMRLSAAHAELNNS